MSESEQTGVVPDNSAEKSVGDDINNAKNEDVDLDDHSLLSESNSENEAQATLNREKEAEKADTEETSSLEEEAVKEVPINAKNETEQGAEESSGAAHEEGNLAEEEKVPTPAEEKDEPKAETAIEQEADSEEKADKADVSGDLSSAKHAQPVDTKEQIRLKKLEEARKKIERLKNKKKQNASKVSSAEPISAPNSPLDHQDRNLKPETSSSLLAAEPSSRTYSSEKTVAELNATIAKLNVIIEDRDREIRLLKLDLENEKQNQNQNQNQKQNQAQFSPPHTPRSPQLEEQYTEINFNDWKSYTLDMTSWRSIGSGPVVQF